MELLRKLYAIASQDKRTDIPLSELHVGLKCGGSDGFSGITANPLLGVFSDFLVAQGGTTVLTEVPEMFGAETILMNRSESKAVFEKTVHLINDFKSYFIENKQPIYENPSPGNKAGGISTLEEKSLGCTQKAGTSAVRDVMLYGERLKTKGLNLLSAPETISWPVRLLLPPAVIWFCLQPEEGLRSERLFQQSKFRPTVI